MLTGNQQQSQEFVGGAQNRLRLHVPWLILISGIVLSITSYSLVRNWEEAKIVADFKMFAATHSAAIHREAIRHFDASIAMVGLYDASKAVDRQEFRQFSKEILTHHTDVQAVMWVPRVSTANAEELRRQAVHDGLTNFHIHEPNEIGSANPN